MIRGLGCVFVYWGGAANMDETHNWAVFDHNSLLYNMDAYD